MSDQPTVILVLAAPRTGTTHFMERHFNRQSVDSYTEPFHPFQVLSLFKEDIKTLARDFRAPGAGMDGDIEDDKTFTRWRRRNPGLVLDHFVAKARRGKKGFIALKIFPQHCPIAEVGALLQRSNVVPVIMHRDLLDGWISEEKALALGTYYSTDTTGFRPTLKTDGFYAWHDKLVGWYSVVAHLTAGMTRFVLRYEDLYGAGADEAAIVQPLLTHLGLEYSPAQGMTRQDTAVRWQDKVANPDAVQTFLDRVKPELDLSTMFS